MDEPQTFACKKQWHREQTVAARAAEKLACGCDAIYQQKHVSCCSCLYIQTHANKSERQQARQQKALYRSSSRWSTWSWGSWLGCSRPFGNTWEQQEGFWLLLLKASTKLSRCSQRKFLITRFIHSLKEHNREGLHQTVEGGFANTLRMAALWTHKKHVHFLEISCIQVHLSQSKGLKCRQ